MFELRAKELINQLHSSGYLKQDIASAIDKARQRSRDALLSYRPKIVSKYDQEIPQSLTTDNTTDNPVAPRGRAMQPSRDTRKTN